MSEQPFQIKDSGERQTYSTGMVRDTSAGKVRYNPVLEGPMFKRWAALLWNAKKKYPDIAPGVGNWTLAETDEELQRAKESAFGHFIDWITGVTDEDHGAQTIFNINLAENIKLKMASKTATKLDEANKELQMPAGKAVRKLPGTDNRDLAYISKSKPFAQQPPIPQFVPESPEKYGYPPGTILCKGND